MRDRCQPGSIMVPTAIYSWSLIDWLHLGPVDIVFVPQQKHRTVNGLRLHVEYLRWRSTFHQLWDVR